MFTVHYDTVVKNMRSSDDSGTNLIQLEDDLG